LGGVARKTRETIILCEAAGYNVIFVETVGVGQSETAVHSMVDFFLLMMLAGAGDELQGIKRGIMEMADGIVINKADGDNIRKAGLARQEFENALHLFPATGSGWIPKVLTSSAAHGTGVPEAWEMISDFITLARANGHFEKRRQEQSVEAFTTSIEDALRLEFFQHKKVQSAFEALKQEILQGKSSPYLAAGKLMELFRKKN
jgi:LAO/AO transport system kinase